MEEQIWDFYDEQGGQVVIYDANNGSKESRKRCLEEFGSKGVHVIFLGECVRAGRAGQLAGRRGGPARQSTAS